MYEYLLEILNAKPEELKDRDCIVPISVGQNYHETPQFRDALFQLAELCKSITIVVADTLQRHTLALTNDAEQARQLAIDNGREWLKKCNWEGCQKDGQVETKSNNNKMGGNFLDLQKLKKQLKLSGKSLAVIHWDDYLKNDRFACHIKIVEEKYNAKIKDNLFKRGIEGAAFTYASYLVNKIRKEEEGSRVEVTDVFEVCKKYLKEECAVFLSWLELDSRACLYYPRKNDSFKDDMYQGVKILSEGKDFIFLKTAHPMKKQANNLSDRKQKKQRNLMVPNGAVVPNGVAPNNVHDDKFRFFSGPSSESSLEEVITNGYFSHVEKNGGDLAEATAALLVQMRAATFTKPRSNSRERPALSNPVPINRDLIEMKEKPTIRPKSH